VSGHLLTSVNLDRFFSVGLRLIFMKLGKTLKSYGVDYEYLHKLCLLDRRGQQNGGAISDESISLEFESFLC